MSLPTKLPKAVSNSMSNQLSFQLPEYFQDPVRLQQRLKVTSGQFWQKHGDARALELFHTMAKRVPAYKDFLKKQKIKAELVKTIADFKQVPTVDKNNYLRVYPLASLVWDGTVADKQFSIASTSGSTGEPYYFPRQIGQDWQYAALAELYLLTNFQIDKKSTLYIVGFPMGQWIGGVFTFQALRLLAERKHYPLSVITPGVNSQEIINAVVKLGPSFDQIIIGSYGPFLKDMLDEAEIKGVNWQQYNLGFIFAAEVFSESFRDFVAKKAGLKNVLTQTLNQYGTVDLGTMSYETPISILARRIAFAKKPLFNQVFNQIYRVPTLTQFFPELFYFEEINEQLICSAFSGIPLTRYDLKDRGRVLSMTQITDMFNEHSVDLLAEAKQAKIETTVWNLPFVYVYERSDFSVSFYAFNIYPETIRRAVLHRDLQGYLTGKFTMLVTNDRKHNQRLEIHLELLDGVESDSLFEGKAKQILVYHLDLENSAYRRTHETIGKRAEPKLTFWPYHHEKYFNPKIKQRWVEKRKPR